MDRYGTVGAVIAAAGSSSRMGGRDKLAEPLDGIPVILRTLAAVEAVPEIREIVVVTREDLLVEVSQICKDFALDKVRKVLVGGAERIHSVQAGLREVDPEAELIAIHDGARPLVTSEVIEEAVAAAARSGAAAPAIPVIDTIKRWEDGLAVETVDRSTLRAVQTPQVFEAGLIRAAT